MPSLEKGGGRSDPQQSPSMECPHMSPRCAIYVVYPSQLAWRGEVLNWARLMVGWGGHASPAEVAEAKDGGSWVTDGLRSGSLTSGNCIWTMVIQQKPPLFTKGWKRVRFFSCHGAEPYKIFRNQQGVPTSDLWEERQAISLAVIHNFRQPQWCGRHTQGDHQFWLVMRTVLICEPRLRQHLAHWVEWGSLSSNCVGLQFFPPAL